MCLLSVFYHRLIDAYMRYEVAGKIITRQLDADMVVFYCLEECCCDALSRFPLVISGKHSVDVCIVHCPESGADVHGEVIGGGDDEYLLVLRDFTVQFQLLELLHQLGTYKLLLHFIATHGAYDGYRLLSLTKTITVNVKLLAEGRVHGKYNFLFHLL